LAVAIILLFVVSIFSVGMAIVVFQPALFQLSYNTTFWEQCNAGAGISINTQLCVQRDSLYSGTIAIPIFMIAVAGIWAYLAVNRRDDL
jgi:hypothetical protein